MPTTETRWQDEPFGEEHDSWDQDTGRIGISLFANAVQVWTCFQDRACSIAETARAFNCGPLKIIEAVEDHAWMFTVGPDDDYEKRMIEHEGE